MKRNIVLIAVMTLTGLVLIAGLVMAHEGMKDVITIDGAQAKKAPVVFPHEEHAEDIDCVTCHHTSEGENVEETCFDCHGQDPEAPDPSVTSLKDNPFHALCRGCHKERGEGPTGCSDCHSE